MRHPAMVELHTPRPAARVVVAAQTEAPAQKLRGGVMFQSAGYVMSRTREVIRLA